MASTPQRSTRGAVPIDGRRERKKPAWLLPLLALLALLAIVGIVIALVSGGDDSKSSSAGKSGSAGTASLTSGGEKLTPSGLKGSIGQDASGKGVVVQSVVPGEGFWVGSSSSDRIYVEYGGGAGVNEDGYQPTKPGERVNLTGPVKPAPDNTAKILNLTEAQAAQIREQGAYVNADSVSRAK